MQLFYNRHIQPGTLSFTFDKMESRHIVRVLRKKEGDPLFITNGSGLLCTAEVSLANDKKCIVTIVNIEEKSKPWPYYLHIAIAPTKNIDRFEWFLEKATEIGVDEITPIICTHSERKVLKIERMQKIVEAAAKQSLKFHFPLLNAPVSFDQFITQHKASHQFIAHCEDQDKQPFESQLTNVKNVTILIGPEGDFSAEEIRSAVLKDYIPVSLGESRLRTETAGLVAAHTVSLCQNRR